MGSYSEEVQVRLLQGLPLDAEAQQWREDQAAIPATTHRRALPSVSPQMLQAVELRLQGKTYKDIADLCGYNYPQNAYAAIRTYYQRYGEDRQPADVRAEAEAQLDEAAALASRIMYDYETKDPELALKAIGQFVRIKERQAKLQNADKATQVNVQEYAKRVALQRGHTIEEAEEIGLLAQSHAETMLREQGLPENDA